MTFLEDCTKELVEKMLEEGQERLECHEIEALVMERAKYLERDSFGGYQYKKPHKAKARKKCEFCKNHKLKIDGLIAIGALDINSIKGKNLACWCKEGTPCHADYLLEVANA